MRSGSGGRSYGRTESIGETWGADTGCDVTNAELIFYSWIVFDGVRKSSFKSQRSSSLG